MSPILRGLYWLRMQQRSQFKITVLTFRCLQGLVPPYLTEGRQRVLDLPSRRVQRLSSTADLAVPFTLPSTVGD
jgi:hypothetical protein